MSIEWDIDISFEGLKASILEKAPVAVGKGLEHLRGVAAELTPIETGHLVGSAEVIVDGMEGQLLYPGPYARRQHFELDWHHNHGQALYLEQPMVSEAEPVLQIITDELGWE